MKTGRLILINAVVFLVIVALGLGGYYYYFDQANYITTEDAKVAGDIVPIASEGAGKLANWKGQNGATFKQGEEVGQVAAGNQTIHITSPIEGTIVQNKALDGQLVAAGQPLAQVVNMKKLYIMANIEETAIKDVSVGQEVDIVIDAFSDTKIKGKVAQIGLTTNSTFSLLPAQNASGDYTKEVQRIPVKIEMERYPEGIVPGMNATIKIHK
ncbi:HlyD family efflux transporter periplasmic adaptor subunit [Thermoflavimicrobium dichotomicum]|uniref:HlyD membrane-fusion protein of T1SS n=1 Tax=Thermoflavimicrobium dichotomicum TaxID=46223 RepID=A0A1I3KJF1_9BACL|nr:HlyD family efflux transporter periplasmic adaptor subunit [Thermoflavimicrobium dichotomicum]SFI72325.1 HlyD membrane-fusion protein of T1SS [Thermoflavimicrobium dichotomicum]